MSWLYLVLKRPVMHFVTLRRGMSFALKRPVEQFIAMVMGCAVFLTALLSSL